MGNVYKEMGECLERFQFMTWKISVSALLPCTVAKRYLGMPPMKTTTARPIAPAAAANPLSQPLNCWIYTNTVTLMAPPVQRLSSSQLSPLC